MSISVRQFVEDHSTQLLNLIQRYDEAGNIEEADRHEGFRSVFGRVPGLCVSEEFCMSVELATAVHAILTSTIKTGVPREVSAAMLINQHAIAAELADFRETFGFVGSN